MLINIILLLGLGLLLVVALVSGLFYSVSGAWEVTSASTELEGLFKDKIILGQFGFIVVGRRELYGGYQTFFGVSFLGYMWLKRRDYGERLFVRQGFDKNLVKQLEGQVMMRLKLYLTKDKLFLKGVVIPYKIEFMRQPPLVTGKHAVAAIERVYRRSESIISHEVLSINPQPK